MPQPMIAPDGKGGQSGLWYPDTFVRIEDQVAHQQRVEEKNYMFVAPGAS